MTAAELAKETWIVMKPRLGFIAFVALWLLVAFVPFGLAFVVLPVSWITLVVAFGWVIAVIVVGSCLQEAYDRLRERRNG